MFITSFLYLNKGFWLFWGSSKLFFVKISQNFIKSPLKICLIAQISVHSLWHVCDSKTRIKLTQTTCNAHQLSGKPNQALIKGKFKHYFFKFNYTESSKKLKTHSKRHRRWRSEVICWTNHLSFYNTGWGKELHAILKCSCSRHPQELSCHWVDQSKSIYLSLTPKQEQLQPFNNNWAITWDYGTFCPP